MLWLWVGLVLLAVLVGGRRTVESMRTCEWCGESFRPGPIGRAPLYCRRTCRELAYRERRTRRRIAEALEAAAASDSSVDESVRPRRRRALPGPAEPPTLF